MRVLVVEDELKVAAALRAGLEAEAYDVAVERTGDAAFYRTSVEAFDLILLDLGPPGRSGLEVLSAIRQKQSRVPVIVLTAREAVRLLGIAGPDQGADPPGPAE